MVTRLSLDSCNAKRLFLAEAIAEIAAATGHDDSLIVHNLLSGVIYSTASAAYVL